MEKRSRRRVPELVTRLAFQGLSENEIGRARISMMARNANVPFKGRIQKRKTYHLQIITFGLQCAAGPYSWVRRVGSTRPRRSRNVRYASNTDRIDAPQKTVALCQQPTSSSALGGRTRCTKEMIVQAARLDPNCPQTMIR
jgi:hypothetical protein